MNTWTAGKYLRIFGKFLPEKKAFYSSLIMEDITDVNYRHAKSVFKYFSNKI